MSRKKQKQTSETFILGALLALSGGFQDAYTYNVRDKVFSNAQTGNVVLMSQHFMTGDFAVALQYLFPILAFAGGVFVADRLHQHFQNSRRFHWRQIVVLWEILILLMVGSVFPREPQSDRHYARILFLFHAGTGFPEDQWIRICQYYVYW